MSLERIVVGVDGSGGGLHALAWVTPVAASLGAEVLVVRVYDDMTEMMSTPQRMEFDELRASALAHVEQWGAPLADAGVAWRPLLVEGDDAADALIGAAVDHGAGLIVIGNVGLTGWRERIVGSFATRVLKHSTVPVTVVPQPRPGA
jgi:nucleotide-binding universal stress UspA family protein